MFYYLFLTIFFIPLLIIYPTRVIGKKNLPKKGGFIFSANHQTLNDPIIIASKILRRRFRFMAKASLFKYKITSAMFKGLGAYPVNRGTGDIAAVKTTLTHLKKGRAVCIFPEGARLKSSESNDLKNGVVMFALKTNSPIIPAYFVKTTYAFRPNTLLIGKPIELHNMEQFKGKKLDKDVLKEASEILKKEINKLYKDYMDKKNKKKKSK